MKEASWKMIEIYPMSLGYSMWVTAQVAVMTAVFWQLNARKKWQLSYIAFMVPVVMFIWGLETPLVMFYGDTLLEGLAETMIYAIGVHIGVVMVKGKIRKFAVGEVR